MKLTKITPLTAANLQKAALRRIETRLPKIKEEERSVNNLIYGNNIIDKSVSELMMKQIKLRIAYEKKLHQKIELMTSLARKSIKL